jgi:hypothetical protein
LILEPTVVSVDDTLMRAEERSVVLMDAPDTVTWFNPDRAEWSIGSR